MPLCQDPSHAVGLERRNLGIQDAFRRFEQGFRRGLRALPSTFARAHLTPFHSPLRPLPSPRERPSRRAIPIVPANLAICRADEEMRLEPPYATDAQARAPLGSRDSRAPGFRRADRGTNRGELAPHRGAGSPCGAPTPGGKGVGRAPPASVLSGNEGLPPGSAPLRGVIGTREVREGPLTLPVASHASR
jgi:hypothetical protein